MKTLFDRLSASRSGSNQLRLFAAMLVFVAHSVTGFGVSGRYVFGSILGEVGLFLFFSLSGILIANASKRTDFPSFMRNRIRRIFPALITMVIITGLIFGPVFAIAEGMSLQEYFGFSRHLGLEYLLTPIYIFVASPGAFDGLLVNSNMKSALNGSLWTIPVELQSYLLAGLITLVPKKIAPKTASLFFAYILWAFAMWDSTHRPEFSSSGTLLMAIFFLSYSLSEEKIVSFRVLAAVGGPLGVSLILLIVSQNLSILLISCAILSPVISVLMATVFENFLPQTKNDYSYGLYLWHYPIIQLTQLFLGTNFPAELKALVAIALSLAAAHLSWNVVERRFQRRR